MNIGIIGGHKCSKIKLQIAQDMGFLIAKEGWITISGGGSGVMSAAAKGVKLAGGISVGILPGLDSVDGNKYLTVKIPTGIGYMRNALIVRACDVLIAIGGEYGTLSEISFALCEGKKVVGIDTWDIDGIIKVKDPESAIRKIKKLFC